MRLSRIAILAGLLAIPTLSIGPTAAFACPPGTVFSAYKGNGLCLIRGQGKEVAAKCTTTKASCPSDMVRKKKNSDPDHVYCCPTTRGVTPNCNAQCAPILTSVTPASEANRVYKNCRLGCMGKKEYLCPDGRMVKTGSNC